MNTRIRYIVYKYENTSMQLVPWTAERLYELNWTTSLPGCLEISSRIYTNFMLLLCCCACRKYEKKYKTWRFPWSTMQFKQQYIQILYRGLAKLKTSFLSIKIINVYSTLLKGMYAIWNVGIQFKRFTELLYSDNLFTLYTITLRTILYNRY